MLGDACINNFSCECCSWDRKWVDDHIEALILYTTMVHRVMTHY